ncbi:MAG: hypothetical protein ACRD20_12440, partial [Terriglobales bacterium]
MIESMNPQWLDLSREWYPWMKECEEGRGASTTEERSQRDRSSSAQHDKTLSSWDWIDAFVTDVTEKRTRLPRP